MYESYRALDIDVKDLFSSPSKKRTIEKYAAITEMFWKIDATQSREFQKNFNGFYRVRRNQAWQEVYYAIMERGKSCPLPFERVLREIYNKTGMVEASFASKLLHTLNPDMPIWDQFVLKHLNIKVPVCKGEKKIKTVARLYGEIVAWYQSALNMVIGKIKIEEFDKTFPEYAWISSTKKIDFLLWQTR